MPEIHLLQGIFGEFTWCEIVLIAEGFNAHHGGHVGPGFTEVDNVAENEVIDQPGKLLEFVVVEQVLVAGVMKFGDANPDLRGEFRVVIHPFADGPIGLLIMLSRPVGIIGEELLFFRLGHRPND
ncbi:hypothetical protein GCM10028805_52150 [Spirosoma harenae]